MVEPADHELVPTHTVLSEEEVEDVLDEYDITRTDLPKIDHKDAALPEGAVEEDVVRITRDSRTTETATVYRLVTE